MTELKITRVIDAPVDAVWRAWVEHGSEWFCPKPWRAEIEVQELRAGGRSKLTMYGPDGEVMPHEGVFLEVVPGRRIVSTDAFTGDWQPSGPFMVRIDEFADEAGKTRYTAIARHWTKEAADQHAAMGFESGWGASADQLADIARRIR
jgi:uncharacterized protein YndB with AHSA1/START domain